MIKNIALVGLGPHAKRIYLSYFQKHKVKLKVLIELESKVEVVRNYLDDNGFEKTIVITITD